MYLSIYPWIYLSIYLLIYLFIYLFIDQGSHRSIYLSIDASISLSIYSSIYLFIVLSIYLSIYRCIDLSIYRGCSSPIEAVPGNRDSQCLRPAHACARARRSTCMQDGSRAPRAREVTLHLTLCFWFYSHKAFLGANIFFCRRFEWREVSISVWQYFSCCSLLPPLPFVPPSQVLCMSVLRNGRQF